MVRGNSFPGHEAMKKILIDKENSGIRIDKFLASYFTKATKDKREFFSLGMTRGEIIRLIKSGDIVVDGTKTRPICISKKII